MTTPVPIDRGVFTDLVIATLGSTGKKIGDARMPRGANWIGQPNAAASYFEPYLVVSEITASTSWGGWGDSQADWQLPYLIEAFGVSRQQVSWMAQKAQEAMTALRGRRGISVGDVTYGVQQVRMDSLGQPQPVTTVNPTLFHYQDGITLWIGKGD